jgi:hypothetical protein
VANSSAALLALAVIGLLRSGRARVCWSFLAYLVALFLGNQLTVHWSATFYTPWFWMVKDAVYVTLLALVPLEIALLTFSGLPRARRRALFAMVSILAVSLWIWLFPVDELGYPYLAAIGVLAPRRYAMALWLFLAVITVAFWSRAPLHPFHRSLLVSFTLFVGTETWLLGSVGLLAASRPAYVGTYAVFQALDPLACAVTAGFWCWAAWRPEPSRALSPVVAGRLQPWAAA